MTMAKARDWTLELVRVKADLVWGVYQRERIDLSEKLAQENRIKDLRNLITEATEEGSLTAEEVREVLKSVAAGALSARPA